MRFVVIVISQPLAAYDFVVNFVGNGMICCDTRKNPLPGGWGGEQRLLRSAADFANLSVAYSLTVSVVANNLGAVVAARIAKYSHYMADCVFGAIELRTTAVAYNLPNRVGMLDGFDIVYPVVPRSRNRFCVGIIARYAGVSAHTRR